eukprot:3181530-Rhodomonas_salina.1
MNIAVIVTETKTKKQLKQHDEQNKTHEKEQEEQQHQNQEQRQNQKQPNKDHTQIIALALLQRIPTCRALETHPKDKQSNTKHHHHPDVIYYLNSLCVNKDLRRNGIATKLLQEINSLYNTVLYVNKGDTHDALIHFYTNRNYAQQQKYHKHSSKNTSNYTMTTTATTRTTTHCTHHRQPPHHPRHARPTQSASGGCKHA